MMMDALHAAALDQPVVHPRYIGFLDLLGDPIRVTTLGHAVAFAAGETGDVDLDGHGFDPLDHRLIGVSDIKTKEGGGDTVSVTLSGIHGVDSALMTQIGNRANWQGRLLRLWRVMVDADGTPIGGFFPFFTGYMTVPKIVGDREGQTIVLDVETYLAFLTAPSNRSYLNQTDYDPGDLSAEAAIAIANGTSGAALAGDASAAGAASLANAGRFYRSVAQLV